MPEPMTPAELVAELRRLLPNIDPRTRVSNQALCDLSDLLFEIAPALPDLIEAAGRLIAAAACIRHWHDSHDGGMVVSGKHVMELWDARDAADTALAAVCAAGRRV